MATNGHVNASTRAALAAAQVYGRFALDVVDRSRRTVIVRVGEDGTGEPEHPVTPEVSEGHARWWLLGLVAGLQGEGCDACPTTWGAYARPWAEGHRVGAEVLESSAERYIDARVEGVADDVVCSCHGIGHAPWCSRADAHDAAAERLGEEFNDEMEADPAAVLVYSDAIL